MRAAWRSGDPRKLSPLISESLAPRYTPMPSDHQKLEALQTPCLLLDEAKVHTNVIRMKSHLGRLGVAFRPHLKTAKALDVARIAMTSLAGPAMVSTLREAEYFA